MNLEDQLDAIRKASEERIPAADRMTMERALVSLRTSDILQRVVRVGQRAPDFTLPNERGEQVSLGALIERGPVVMSFLRGRW